VAVQAPKNLTMVVWDNGLYQITGSQPTATKATADIVAIARGAGLANSAWAADEDEFERLMARALKDGGPSLIAARIDNQPGVGKTERDPVQIRFNFMRGIAATLAAKK
jgi:thiamine pyrophosphate-dependent acetolactate synthase large subunit-like protein